MRILRKNPVVWVVLLVPVALVLGYVGFRSIPNAAMGRSDALFSSLQLFALEGSVNPHGTPWSLNVARFLAPFTVVFVSALAVLAILRDQLQRLLVSLFARDHIVVVGLGRSGALLATALKQAGRAVVVVESDASNERISAVRAHGVRVIIGDASHPVILRRAAILRARHVIIASGDDSRNLEVGDRSRALILVSRRKRPTVHIAVSDQNLWLELGRLHMGHPPTGVTIEFYNDVDRQAQALLNEAERATGIDSLRCVAVEGDGVLAQRLLVHLVRRAVLAGIRPKLFVSRSTADSVVEPAGDRDPWIRSAADVVVEPPSTSSSSAAVAFVCMTGPDSLAMARGLALSAAPDRIAVYVAVQGQQTDALLESTVTRTAMHLVSVDFRALGDEFLRQSGHELMARARHEDYLAQERAKGATITENPSLVNWQDLPTTLKESNRRFAGAVAEIIHDLGGQLVPLRELEARSALFESSSVLERLAMDEHERWMAALREDGWKYSANPKDPVGRTHPLLVSWAELPEVEKEKDRDAIRAIPRMLARIGFAVEVPDSVRGERGGLEEAGRPA